jgi:hypothetical protein
LVLESFPARAAIDDQMPINDRCSAVYLGGWIPALGRVPVRLAAQLVGSDAS